MKDHMQMVYMQQISSDDLLSSLCRDNEGSIKEGLSAGAMATFTNPLASPPAYITDGNHLGIITAKSALLGLRRRLPSAVSCFLCPVAFLSLRHSRITLPHLKARL